MYILRSEYLGMKKNLGKNFTQMISCGEKELDFEIK